MSNRYSIEMPSAYEPVEVYTSTGTHIPHVGIVHAQEPYDWLGVWLPSNQPATDPRAVPEPWPVRRSRLIQQHGACEKSSGEVLDEAYSAGVQDGKSKEGTT